MSTLQSSYTPLAELAKSVGQDQPCSSNLPANLDDPDSIWYIEQGTVNLFLVEQKNGEIQTAPGYLMSREAGWLIFGVAPHIMGHDTSTDLHLIAKGSPDTLLKRLSISNLSQVDPAELGQQIDTWLLAMIKTLARFTKHLPRPTVIAKPGTIKVSANSTLAVSRELVWVSNPVQGSLVFMDVMTQSDIVNASGRYQNEIMIPLTRNSWLTLFEESTLTGVTSETLAARGDLMSVLASFHALALSMEQVNRQLEVVDNVNLERSRTIGRRDAALQAKRHLFNLYDLPIDQESAAEDTALRNALQIIGQREKIDFIFPEHPNNSQTPVKLKEVLSASCLRGRCVRLNTKDKWWWTDSGSMLAFRAEDGQPVALIPGKLGHYREIDPISKRSVRVTAARTQTLKNEAWVFYPPLPTGDDQSTSVLKFILHGSNSDIVRLMTTGIAHGLTRLVPAFALGFVANQLVESTGAQSLNTFAAALAGFAFLSALFHVLRSNSLLRLQWRSNSRIEAAFWDHLMRLPVKILQQYPKGELASLGAALQKVRDSVQGAVADSLLSIIFLLPIFAVIFFYDATLGSIALVFSLFSMLVTVVLGIRQLAPYGRMISTSRRATGHLLQIIEGITKLRIEGAEGSAFAIWAKNYREQKRAEIEVASIQEHCRAFGAALPFVAAGTLLFALMQADQQHIPVGDFLVIYTLFLIFQSAIAQLADSFGTIAASAHVFVQMQPLLNATPENESKGENVDYIGGNVLFDRVSFRYEDDGPLILDDVTIEIRAGEFIGIAGASGTGKSTLYRLALGIDEPTTGAVYYDGRDLRNLNLKQVRQKIGSVLQSVRLHPHDLWDNIVAHHESVDSDEVWSAIGVAGVADEIKRMPMGLMTMVGSSGAVLSGGESQRVSIARAVLRDPRVILFDEATNWMDNESQANLMENLSSLNSTRIVIAHRLTTLRKADRIYVLEGGRVVQCGSFAELMDVEGAFKDLVKRQIA